MTDEQNTSAEVEDLPEGQEDLPNPGEEGDTEPELFPREYVQQLRQEAADNRVKAKRADDLAHRLHTALVAASGRLADPEDLPFSDANLETPEALDGALEDLLARKPHLASRKPRGLIGAGATAPGDTLSLAGMLRTRA